MEVVMVEAGVAGFQNSPILVQPCSCTWGALLLVAAAALGSLVRTLRKAVRRLPLHRVRAPGARCDGGGMAASVVPVPFPVDFSQDDDEDVSERRCLASCSDSGGERRKVYEQEHEDHDDEGLRLGCCVDGRQEESDVRKRRDQQQDWGFGRGGWDSWFRCGGVVKAWEQDQGHTDGVKGYFCETSWGGAVGGGAFGGFVPLIKSFCLEPSTLTLSCSDGIDLQLWDSRLRSCVPAAVIAPTATLRRRPAVGVGASAGDNDKVVYVAERRGGRVTVDLRNTKGDLHGGDSVQDAWWEVDPMFVPEADRAALR